MFVFLKPVSDLIQRGVKDSEWYNSCLKTVCYASGYGGKQRGRRLYLHIVTSGSRSIENIKFCGIMSQNHNTKYNNRNKTADGGFDMCNQMPRPEYPRPQFERSEWQNLNGEWSYTLDLVKTGWV